MLNEGDPEECDCLRNGDGERHEKRFGKRRARQSLPTCFLLPTPH